MCAKKYYPAPSHLFMRTPHACKRMSRMTEAWLTLPGRAAELEGQVPTAMAPPWGTRAAFAAVVTPVGASNLSRLPLPWETRLDKQMSTSSKTGIGGRLSI